MFVDTVSLVTTEYRTPRQVEDMQGHFIVHMTLCYLSLSALDRTQTTCQTVQPL